MDLDAIRTYRNVHRSSGQEKDCDVTAKAQVLLEDKQAEKYLFCHHFRRFQIDDGNTILFAGQLYTGQFGVFWILDADTHTWKKNLYTTKLTLSYQVEMREG